MTLGSIALWGILVFSVMGLFFGVALAATARKFYVPGNPLIDEVYACLPAANCGACGFPGCKAYAEAVVETPDLSPALCIPGGQDCANAISSLTGKNAGEILPVQIVLNCHGTNEYAKTEAEYTGVKSCAAAAIVFGGPKSCKSGCMGFGDCVQKCAFDALKIGGKGILEIDSAKCTGCGKCAAACPKVLLQLVPRNHRVRISCSTTDRAVKVRSVCSVGCLSCKKCVRSCPAQAVTWDGRIRIDHAKCVEYGSGCNEVCTDCPTGIFHRKDQFSAKVKASAAEA